MLSPLKFLFARSRAAAAPLAPPAGVDASTSDAGDSVITMDPALLTDDDADTDSQLDSGECVTSEAAHQKSEEPASLGHVASTVVAPVEQPPHPSIVMQEPVASLESGSLESVGFPLVASAADMPSAAPNESMRSAVASLPGQQQENAVPKAPRAKAAAKPRAEPKPKTTKKPKSDPKDASRSSDQGASPDGSPGKSSAKPRRAPAKRGLSMNFSTSDWILPGDPRAPVMKIVYPKEEPVHAAEEPQDVPQHVDSPA